MSEERLSQIRKMLSSAKSAISSAEEMLKEVSGVDLSHDYNEDASKVGSVSDGGKVIEGVFNGEKMTGPDNREYPVPANYASKSKLIPGDVLKLTITDDGRFLYKQIGPAARKSIIGVLVKDGGQFGVMVDDRLYKVLLASVTYHKAELGDQITLVVPEADDSDWGAIEAVLPQAMVS